MPCNMAVKIVKICLNRQKYLFIFKQVGRGILPLSGTAVTNEKQEQLKLQIRKITTK